MMRPFRVSSTPHVDDGIEKAGMLLVSEISDA